MKVNKHLKQIWLSSLGIKELEHQGYCLNFVVECATKTTMKKYPNFPRLKSTLKEYRNT